MVAAETLRQEGFKGRVILACRENVLPYDRIKLSKVSHSHPHTLTHSHPHTLTHLHSLTYLIQHHAGTECNCRLNSAEVSRILFQS